MVITKENIKTEDKFVLVFEQQKAQMDGGAHVLKIRENAMKDFLSRGIPGRKNEEYKYSNPVKLFQEEYAFPEDYLLQKSTAPKQFSATEAENYKKTLIELIPDLNSFIIVLVNGSFREELSELSGLPKGVIVKSLKLAFEENPEHIQNYFNKCADSAEDAFADLNTAFCRDGVFIYVSEGVRLEKAFHIINSVVPVNHQVGQADNLLIMPRHLFIAEKNSEVKIIESFDSCDSGKVLINGVTEVFVKEQARAHFYKLQNGADKGSQISGIHVRQYGNSHFDTNLIVLKGLWVRNNLRIEVAGRNCETFLNGLFITNESQHVDNHTLVDHQQPDCESRQLYKGILDGKSAGVFNGKIYVRKDAQKINAYQSSKNILLSDDAAIYTKPQLEIYADDVKCSHGSSTGRINEEALFYLRSRGIGTEAAKRLLLFAFVSDVLKTITIEPLRNHLDTLLKEKLT